MGSLTGMSFWVSYQSTILSQSAILSNVYQFVILVVKVSYEYELSKIVHKI